MYKNINMSFEEGKHVQDMINDSGLTAEFM